MSDEEKTKEFDTARPILERILMRLDSMDARLYSVETRLSALEEQNEQRAMDTKPIWERALTEIAETRAEMHEGFQTIRAEINDRFTKLERKLELDMRVINDDRHRSRVEIEDLRDRMDQLEKTPS
jgi:hypothetical protein